MSAIADETPGALATASDNPAVSARGGAAVADGCAAGNMPGKAVKNSFAMRAKTPGSRTPAGML